MVCIPPFNEGDRIELISMTDDPCPVLEGAQGTVTRVVPLHLVGSVPDQRRWQVGVNWDSGRTLSLVVPPDEARLLN